MSQSSKTDARLKRKIRIRKKIFGTLERPRLVVFKSSQYIYAQVIDDAAHKTLASCSSAEKKIKAGLKSSRSVDASVAVGKEIAQRTKSLKINNVVFDRNGFVYHGRIKALADGAREAGLNF